MSYQKASRGISDCLSLIRFKLHRSPINLIILLLTTAEFKFKAFYLGNVHKIKEVLSLTLFKLELKLQFIYETDIYYGHCYRFD